MISALIEGRRRTSATGRVCGTGGDSETERGNLSIWAAKGGYHKGPGNVAAHLAMAAHLHTGREGNPMATNDKRPGGTGVPNEYAQKKATTRQSGVMTRAEPDRHSQKPPRDNRQRRGNYRFHTR